MNIAVLGASKIGKFHVREFANAGAHVVAILGSSSETAAQTARALSIEFGIHVTAYVDLGKLLETEHIDAVSICTPPALHYAQAKKCLEAGLHVLCEKPFVLDSCTDNYPKAQELVELSEKNGKILTVNTQWPAVLEVIKSKVDFSTLKSFSMCMQPESLGVDMLIEQLAHTNSIVVKLFPDGHVEDIQCVIHSTEEVDVSFKYKNNHSECSVSYKFIHKAERPRKVIFSFDGMEWRREVGENYQQRLVTENAVFDIVDPLKTSIGRFVSAVDCKSFPLVSTREIIENVALQDCIVAEYMKEACP